MRFVFQTVPLTQRYCELVVECLVKCCGKTEGEAVELVNRFWGDIPSFPDDDYRLHELPYYSAMAICHHPILGDNTPEWWRDERNWPPPPEYSMPDLQEETPGAP
jgi:hypothetical protein